MAQQLLTTLQQVAESAITTSGANTSQQVSSASIVGGASIAPPYLRTGTTSDTTAVSFYAPSVGRVPNATATGQTAADTSQNTAGGGQNVTGASQDLTASSQQALPESVNPSYR